LIHIALALAPLICYLEWSGGHSAFVYQMEYNILFQHKNTSGSFTHPLVLLPLLGQLLILFTVFQKQPGKRLALAGQVMLSLLVVMILVAGILSLNIKIILSTVPFIIASVAFYLSFKRVIPKTRG
jgi:heme A synthase